MAQKAGMSAAEDRTTVVGVLVAVAPGDYIVYHTKDHCDILVAAVDLVDSWVGGAVVVAWYRSSMLEVLADPCSWHLTDDFRVDCILV